MPIASVDTHFHLWDLSHGKHGWLQAEPDNALNENAPGQIRLTALRKSYLVADFLHDTEGMNVAKGIHVEAKYDEDDPVAETAWLQSVADRRESRGFPHGIVAYANLVSPNAAEVVEAHAAYANFRGIRQILNQPTRPDEPEYLLEPKWRDNFALLRRYDASFDLQIYAGQMQAAANLARRYPETQIVLNHAGMPLEVTGEGFDNWRRSLQHLATCDNVAAKISGLGMTVPYVTADVARPVVETAIDSFGVDRVMFGSNFPVDRQFGSFEALWTVYLELAASFSLNEQRKLFHDNAVRVYRL